MAPSAVAGPVGLHEAGPNGDRQLVGGEAHGGCGRLGGIIEEGAEQTHRTELHRDAESVVVATVLGDEGAVGVVEVEVARELVGRGLAREAAVAAGLVVGEEADWHRSGLLGRRRRLGRALAE